MASEPASPDEGGAFSTLKPAMAGCIPKGRFFVVTRAVVRGLIAETMYRMASGSVQGGKGSL